MSSKAVLLHSLDVQVLKKALLALFPNFPVQQYGLSPTGQNGLELCGRLVVVVVVAGAARDCTERMARMRSWKCMLVDVILRYVCGRDMMVCHRETRREYFS